MAEPENSSTIPKPQSPTESAEHADTSASINRGPESAIVAKPLTPEEQMALYEEELKENDWGHQPC
jgi:hypothetical protein